MEPADDWGQPPPPVPLILSEQRVGAGHGAVARPGRALLLSHRDGRIVQFPRTPRLGASRGFHWQYEVDVSDHHAVFFLLVPSRSKAAKFRLTVQAGWRVTDPARIVSSRAADGNAIVASRITEALLPICRSYVIDDDARLEQHLVEALGGERVHNYPEGIALFRFSVQVDHDRKPAERIEATVEEELTWDRMKRLREEVSTQVDLYLLYIQRNPDQLHQVISSIQQNRQLTATARLDLFNKMVENDLIQEADLDSFRRQIVTPIGEMVTSSDAIFGPHDLAEPARPAIAAPDDKKRDVAEDEDEDEEDVMPGQVISGSVDGVSGWRQPPWQQDDRQDGS